MVWLYDRTNFSTDSRMTRCCSASPDTSADSESPSRLILVAPREIASMIASMTR